MKKPEHADWHEIAQDLDYLDLNVPVRGPLTAALTAKAMLNVKAKVARCPFLGRVEFNDPDLAPDTGHGKDFEKALRLLKLWKIHVLNGDIRNTVGMVEKVDEFLKEMGE